jgi:hypothetical protein
MGIKMSKARLITTNEEIKVNNATLEMREKKLLKCYTENCNAKVTWVRLSKENYEVKNRYYRLLNGEQHCMECCYNTLGRVTIIAKKADKKIIENINNNKFEFRVNIVYEALKTNNSKEELNTNIHNTSDVNRKKKVYKPIGVASPHLAVMKDIMKLRSEIEDKKELEDIIKIKSKGKSIAWKNFYYELGEEETLYKYIDNNGYVYKENLRKLSYPICIEGIIDSEIEYNEAGSSFINFKLSKYINPDETGNLNFYKCTLFTGNKNLIDSINNSIIENKRIKIVSYFIPTISYKANGKYKNYQISGWVNHEQQIYIESI